MKKLLLAITIFTCLLSSKIGSQIATVYDITSRLPLENVTFFSYTPSAFSYSNSKGQVDLSKFKGSESIEVRMSDYAPLDISYKELEENGFIIHLIASRFTFNEFILVDYRGKQKSTEIPSKVVSITSKDLYLQNPQTAADLLKTSGKVFIQKSQQGGGSPMIRGFATNRLIYSVDGVRMNTAIFRGGNIQNVISLDPLAIEQTEVFFGPSSVMYGSDAIGGVMSFKTLQPKLSLDSNTYLTGNAFTRFATANNEQSLHFDVNVGFDKWAFLTSISYNDYDDLRMGSQGASDSYLKLDYVRRVNGGDQVFSNENPMIQNPSGYNQTNLMQKVRYITSNWDFNYGFHYSETSSYSRYDRLLQRRNNLPRYAEWNYGPQKWMMNNISGKYYDNNGVFNELTFVLAHQYFEESRLSRDLNSNNREVRTEKVYAYSLNLDLLKVFDEKSKLLYGLEGVINDVNSKGKNENIASGLTTNGPSRYPDASWISGGLYASYQYKYSEKSTFLAGARYNLVDIDASFDTNFYPLPFTKVENQNSSLTGNIGWVFRPDSTWILNASVSTAFRSPNVDDIGKIFDSEPGSVVVPNPDLKAEYAYNFEIGGSKIIDKKLKLDVNAYYTILDNALVRRNFTLNGQDSIVYDGELSQVQAIQNAASATVYGLQVGFDLKLPSGFGISSHWNFQKGEEEQDNGSISPSRHAAPWFGVTRLTYSSKKLDLQFYTEYSGKRSFEDMPISEISKPEIYASDKNGNPFSPGWFTLNFKSSYKFNENFMISAGIENLLDKRYRPYSSGLVAPGRNLIMSLRASF